MINPGPHVPPTQAGRRARSPVRVALLGAVSVAVLGGAFAGGTFLPQNFAPAAHAQAITAQPSVGPSGFADIVDRVSPAVVSVKVKMTETADASDNDGGPQQGMPQLRPGDPLERFFRQFRGGNGGGGGNSPFGQQQQRPRTGTALGSGFIISDDGYVVTNNHVVENATDVQIQMQDGSSHAAKIIGTDKKTDLALLKISDGAHFAHVEWGTATPRVGDWVIAVGNPFGLGGTVTAGIVSARGRDIGAGPYDDFLQIDAPVNRGNSGGPTFNTRGEVVGINTAIFSPSGGSVGIGFAIPAEVAKTVIGSLRDHGSVDRGWIGVQIQPVTPEIADSLGLNGTHGALVAEAQGTSPAAAAGIRSGDVITTVNGTTIDGPRELARMIASMGPDSTAKIGYVHDGSAKTADVKLGTLPADQQVASAATGNRSDRSSVASLGLTLAPANQIQGAGRDGVAVTDVDPDGVAAQKGFRSGDIILDAGGKTVSRPSDVSAAIATAKKDGRKAVLFRVKTGDATRYVALATPTQGG